MSLERHHLSVLDPFGLFLPCLMMAAPSAAQEPYQLPEMSVIDTADEETRFTVDPASAVIGRPGGHHGQHRQR